MRALRLEAGELRLTDTPTVIPDGWVRVRVRSVGVCSTDVATVARGGSSPRTLGHEIAGELDDGTPVAVEPMAPCGSCVECVRGSYNCCTGNASAVRGGSYLGFSYDGGYAEYVYVPPRSLVTLAPSLRAADACVVEPVAVALHGLRIAGLAAGQRVAVVGAGAIGLAAVACARALGCEVGVVARHPHQWQAAERLGASGAASGHYDIVVDAAGSRDAVATAVGHAHAGATLLFLALHYGDIPISGVTMLANELRTVTSFGYNRHAGGRDIDAAATLVAQEPEIARTLITHRLPLDEGAQAFRLAADRKAGAIRVVLEP
jgi:threonine dehydrogenase-like Zn-dependent dehydrogenase